MMYKYKSPSKKYNDGGMLTEFNAGGTHEQNPNGGIPLGQNALVEQGETRFQDFIFSDSIKINKLLAKEFNLPKKLIGKSFADASKHYNDKERPNDIITRKGSERELNNLAQAQEAFKQATQPQENQQGNMPMMKDGGFIGDALHMMARPTLNVAKNLGLDINEMFDIPEHEYSSKTMAKISDINSMGASTVANMVAPGVGSLAASKESAAFEGDTSIKNNPTERLFKYGGKMKYKKGGPFDNGFNTESQFDFGNVLAGIDQTQLAKNQEAQQLNKTNTLTEALNVLNPLLNKATSTNVNQAKPEVKPSPESVNKFDSSNLAYLKYAPVATSALSAGIIAANKPEMRDIDSFTNNQMLTPNYLDSNQMESAVRRETDKNRGMISQVGGSAGQVASNLMGVSLQGSRAVADANLNVQQFNTQEKSRVQAGNVELENRNNQIRMSNREANRADRAAYLGALMDELNNAGMNIGQVGLESYRMNMANDLGFDYYMDPTGKTPYFKNNKNKIK